MRAPVQRQRSRGASMIEVLVTISILATGLFGLAGLQSRLQLSEMEAYQRAQAMILLSDMGHRIAVNRNFAATYATATPLGEGAACPTAVANLRDRDKREWCLALKGAAEQLGTSRVGAMLGGRGCVEAVGTNEYLVTVAWQGMAPISAPPAANTCGKDLYNGAAGTPCKDDLCRRIVTTIVRVAEL